MCHRRICLGRAAGLWKHSRVRLVQRAHPNRAARLRTAAFLRLRWLLVLGGVVLVGWIWWRGGRAGSNTAPTPLPSPRPPSSALTSTSNAPSGPKFSQEVFEAQLALTRRGLSVGSIDGVIGAQTRAALRVFQRSEGLPGTGEPDAATRERLGRVAPLTLAYVVSADDQARLQPMGATWLAKSQQDRLDYETVLELVAEKGHAHPALVRRLNPDIDWASVLPGTTVRIPNAEYPPVTAKAAQVRIFLAARTLQVFDGEERLLAHFPCSIAQRVEKRPAGETLHVAVLAPNPNYTFDPAVFPESAEARELGRKLILQPGPNNPVGEVWIGLDKPGYGIHGTPRPEEVGRTESHGCFRLANWNAEHLLKLAWVGMPVVVEE